MQSAEQANASLFAVLRRISKYLKPHRWKLIANLVFAVLAVAMSLLFPKILGYIIDEIIQGGASEMLAPAVLALAATFLLRDLFTGLRNYFNNRLDQDVVYDMRRELYDRLQLLPVSFFDQRASGDLMARVTDDVGEVERVLIDGTEQGLIALLSVTGAFAILLASNAGLALWALAPVPFLLAGMLCYARIALQRYRAVRLALGQLNTLLHENLQAIRQIKAFDRLVSESARFAERAANLRRRALATFEAWAVYGSAMSFFGAMGTVLVIWQGGRMVLAGSMTIGELVSFLFYLALLYQPFGQLHGLNQMLQSARAASERVFEILDSPKEADAKNDAGFAAPLRGDVRFDDVSFSYSAGRPALKHVSFIARPNTVLALVGPTGAGKSTAVSLLLGLYRPNAGRILIDGQDIAAIGLSQLRQQISYVSQETFLFNGTLRDNLLFGRLDATESELIAAAKTANCHDFISRLPEGYETAIGERGVQLSAGERQRVSIARAVLRDTPLLVLDEATANLDNATEALIQEALKRLMVDRTTIVVAHRLNTIRAADQIVVLDEGRVIEQGTHRALIDAGGLYASMVERAVQGLLAEGP